MTAMRHAMLRVNHARTTHRCGRAQAWGHPPQWTTFTAALRAYILLNSASTRLRGGLVVCFAPCLESREDGRPQYPGARAFFSYRHRRDVELGHPAKRPH